MKNPELERMVRFLALPGIGVCAWLGRDPDDLTVDSSEKICPFLFTALEMARHRNLFPICYFRDVRDVLVCYTPEGGLVPCRGNQELASHFPELASRFSRLGPNGSLALDEVLESVASSPDRRDRGQPGLLLFFRGDELLGSGQAANRMVELLAAMNQNIARREERKAILIYFRSEEDIPERLRACIQPFGIPPPNAEEKEIFIRKTLPRYPEARLDGSLTVAEMARISEGVSNTSTLRTIQESAAFQRPITAQELRKKRQMEVWHHSERLLMPMEGREIRLVGKAIQPVLRYMRVVMERLERGDPATPLLIVLAGPPGVGKTALVVLLAYLYPSVRFYRTAPLRNSLVGQSERNVNTILRISGDFPPSVVFIDEFTGNIPTKRVDANTDSGVNNAMLAMILEGLGSQERAGKSLVIGTTNDPSLIDSALLDRAQVLPVLNPFQEDYPEILAEQIAFLNGEAWDPKEPWVQEAAAEFYRRRASPRGILDALRVACIARGRLGPEEVLEAARGSVDKANSPQWHAARLAELRAIQRAVHHSLFPWNGDPALIPEHLRGVFTFEGQVDEQALEDEIRALEGYLRLKPG